MNSTTKTMTNQDKLSNVRINNLRNKIEGENKGFNENLISQLEALIQKKKDLMVLYEQIVSEIKMEEMRMLQIRKNYESFFNTINDFLIVMDVQGKIIYANSTVINRLGYMMEELETMSVLDLHPPDHQKEAALIVSEMLNGKAEFCPIPLVTKNGIQIPVETRVTSGYWDGKPVIFGVTKDISKIKFSEEKFSKVFYLNPSVCGLSDIDTGEYIEVNDLFYNLFGYSKNEVIGSTALKLGILDEDTINKILNKADENGKVSNVEADLKSKDGSIKHVFLSAENIKVQNKTYRYTVVHDITELKKAEKEIKLKNEELFKLNAEKDKFFSIIAHDLRSPFNGFLGLTEIMAVDLPNLTMNQIQEFAINIGSSANNLFRLLNNLLEWSQIQKGTFHYTPNKINLSAMMEDCLGLLRDSAKAKKIIIEMYIMKELNVIADSNMLQSIIRNIVSNSIKFTHIEGCVKISAQKTSRDYATISISDTGIGMDQKMIDELFRIDISNVRKGTEGENSTGLGLLLCKEFVDKHGGKIWIESTVNIGTTFNFSIPLCK